MNNANERKNGLSGTSPMKTPDYPAKNHKALKEIEKILNQFIVYGRKQQPFVCARCVVQTEDDSQLFCYCNDPDTSPRSDPNWIKNINYPRYTEAKGKATQAITNLIAEARAEELEKALEEHYVPTMLDNMYNRLGLLKELTSKEGE